MTAEELIECYRRTRVAVGFPDRLRPYRLDPTDRATASRFLDWCSRRVVDPEAFVARRLANLARKGVCCRFENLKSEALVPVVQRDSSGEWGKAMSSVLVFDQAVRELALITSVQESVRRRHFLDGAPDECMRNAVAKGFDPRSRYCPQCPVRAECEASLREKWGFDVAALRARRLGELPQAVVRVLRGWDGGVSV